MTAALYVLLSVMQYIFLFKKDVLCVTRVVQVLHLRLKHDDVKIQMLSVFSLKPAQPGYVKIEGCYFQKLTIGLSLYEVELLKLCGKFDKFN